MVGEEAIGLVVLSHARFVVQVIHVLDETVDDVHIVLREVDAAL